MNLNKNVNKNKRIYTVIDLCIFKSLLMIDVSTIYVRFACKLYFVTSFINVFFSSTEISVRNEIAFYTKCNYFIENIHIHNVWCSSPPSMQSCLPSHFSLILIQVPSEH